VFYEGGQEVMFCDTGRVRTRPVNMATLLLVSVLVAHLLHFESEINKGKKRHSRNATVIWQGGGSLALLAAKTARAACQKVGRIARAFSKFSFRIVLFAFSFGSVYICCMRKYFSGYFMYHLL
jgi:hypothetical protein